MNILFLDIETTGLNPEKHSIIQIAARYYKDGKEISYYENNIIPDEDSNIDLGALKINKNKCKIISELSIKRTSNKEAVLEFCDYLLGLDNNLILCGHNINFDLSFIKNWFKKYNIEGIESLLSYRVLDTATIAIFLKEAGKLNIEKFSLKELAKALNIDFDENILHDAKADVQLTERIYFKMLELVK